MTTREHPAISRPDQAGPPSRRGIAARLAGPTMYNDRGDALDPSTQLLVKAMEQLPLPKAPDLTPPKARVAFARQLRMLEPFRQKVSKVEDHFCHGPGGQIRLRIVWPRRIEETPLPVLVYFHGGGNVVGDVDVFEGLYRRFSNESQAIVVGVDYRKAPEHPFPAGLEDAVAAYEWAVTSAEGLGGDPQRMAVGGDSGGGGLAASLTHVIRDREGPRPALQVLAYPSLDLTISSESHETFREGPYLDRRLKKWYRNHFLSWPEEAASPLASPFLAPRLEGLPPAIVAVAGFDPVRDEGEGYADRLHQAGVPVVTQVEPDLIHGYLNAPLLRGPRQASRRLMHLTSARLHSRTAPPPG